MLKNVIEEFKQKNEGFDFNKFILDFEQGISREKLCDKFNITEMVLRKFIYSLGLNFVKSKRVASVKEFRQRLSAEDGQNIDLVTDLELELEKYVGKTEQLYKSLTLVRDENSRLRKGLRQEARVDNQINNETELVSKALSGLISEIDSKYQSTPMPITSITNADLLTMYPYTDLHIGMLALKEVSGYDFDLKIVEKWVLASMEHLVQVSPNSETCLIAEMGDFLHAENDDNRTKSGHSLDVDTRHSKIIEVAFNLMISLIEKALTKHKYVKFLSISGNHSENSSHYLKAVIKAYFRNEPRVEVVDDSRIHQYYKFGKVLLGYTHGHTNRSSTKLVECMLEDNLPIISNTKYRYWHIGHLHSNHRFLSKEDAFCSIEIHKNLPPRDAWAAGAGFRGNIGQVKSITYHKDYGEIGRNNWVVDMLPNSN